MKFTYSIPVEKRRESAWEKMQDTESMIRCIPGIEEVHAEGEGRYRLAVVTKLGPVRLRFQGTGTVSSSEDDYRMQADVSMSDARSGNLYGRFNMRLEVAETESPPIEGMRTSDSKSEAVDGADEVGSTRIQIESDIAIAGKLGEFARPLIRHKADQIVREFTNNLRQRLA